MKMNEIPDGSWKKIPLSKPGKENKMTSAGYTPLHEAAR